MTDQPKCSTCLWHDGSYCHRYPPTVAYIPEIGWESTRPATKPDDRCGEHEEASATSEPQDPNWWWDLGVRGRRAMLVTKMPDAEVLDIDLDTFRGAERILEVHGAGETTVREIVRKCREAHGMPPHDES
jgi:hypothetical protein